MCIVAIISTQNPKLPQKFRSPQHRVYRPEHLLRGDGVAFKIHEFLKIYHPPILVFLEFMR